jgi:hypothetical protein
MRYWTYGEIKTKVEKDLELQDEAFISGDELLSYYNEAVDDAESHIHTIYEDYFLTSANLALIEGQSEYALPEDIYANKVRSIVYSANNIIFPIRRMKDWKKFETGALANTYQTPNCYHYLIKNPSAAAGIKLVLYPSAKESSNSNVTIWYLRNANRATASTSICDIPEFASYVIQFMKVKCLEKEGHPNLTFATQTLDYLRKQMVETLSEMVPDSDNEIETDLTAYEEMT